MNAGRMKAFLRRRRALRCRMARRCSPRHLEVFFMVDPFRHLKTVSLVLFIGEGPLKVFRQICRQRVEVVSPVDGHEPQAQSYTSEPNNARESRVLVTQRPAHCHLLRLCALYCQMESIELYRT